LTGPGRAGLHWDFLQLGAANALATPGNATMLGREALRHSVST